LMAAFSLCFLYFFPVFFGTVMLASAPVAGLHLFPKSVAMTSGALFADLTMTNEQITLYMSPTCPWAARARIVVREVKANFTEYEVDLQNKPYWYFTVNPLGLVPAIAYGGPIVPPDQPSPESVKLRESGLIIEWGADEFPQANLLPGSPLERYQARLIIDTVTTKLAPALEAFVFGKGTSQNVLKSVELLQNELVPGVEYALSDQYTIADIGATPFIGRLVTLTKNDLGVCTKPGESKAVYDLITTDARFSTFWTYAQHVLARPSVTAITNVPLLLEVVNKRIAQLKESEKC